MLNTETAEASVITRRPSDNNFFDSYLNPKWMHSNTASTPMLLQFIYSPDLIRDRIKGFWWSEVPVSVHLDTRWQRVINNFFVYMPLRCKLIYFHMLWILGVWNILFSIVIAIHRLNFTNLVGEVSYLWHVQITNVVYHKLPCRCAGIDIYKNYLHVT